MRHYDSSGALITPPGGPLRVFECRFNRAEDRCCNKYQSLQCPLSASDCRRNHICVHCGEMGHPAIECRDLRRDRKAARMEQLAELED